MNRMGKNLNDATREMIESTVLACERCFGTAHYTALRVRILSVLYCKRKRRFEMYSVAECPDCRKGLVYETGFLMGTHRDPK